MILLNWYREWLELRKDMKVCQTCETLKIQVEQLRLDNEKLLERILEKPSVVESKPADNDLKPIKTSSRFTPWSVRQQMLEAEDRQTAKLMKNKEPETVEELEKELDIAEQSRGV